MKSSAYKATAKPDQRPPNALSARHPQSHRRIGYCDFSDSPGGGRGAVSLAIVDDDVPARQALACILEGADGFSCSACFSSAAAAMVEIPRVRPDLVLIDVRLPDLNGIECAKRLKCSMPQLKIVMMSGLVDADLIRESLWAGAVDFLIKPISAAQCLATLTCAVYGGTAREQSTDEAVRSSPSAPLSAIRSPLLSPRENEVMRLVVRGWADKEIAGELQISCGTAHNYVRSSCAKLGVRNRTEATIRFLGLNVI